MKYALSGTIFASSNILDAIINDVNLSNATEKIASKIKDMNNVETVSFIARFNNIIDRNALFDKIKAYALSTKTNLMKHRCFHDESPFKPCEVEEVWLL